MILRYCNAVLVFTCPDVDKDQYLSLTNVMNALVRGSGENSSAATPY